MTARELSGPSFWDNLCGPKGGQYPEYVTPDIWFGEYVAKLEDGQHQSANSNASRGDTGSGSSGTQVLPSKLPRWKRRTPEQIEANKAAQKRFREKKKAKLGEASTKVEVLSERVKSLDALNDEVAALEQSNMELETSLWQKEAQLNQIKMDLNEQTPQSAYDEKIQSRCLPSFISQPQPLQDCIEKVAKRWLREKEALEQLLAAEGLPPERSSQPKPRQIKEVEKRSLAVMGQCMEIMTLGGPQLDVLLRTLADRDEDLMRRAEIRSFSALAQSLDLSGQQMQRLLEVRESVLQRLGRLYDDRQGLNMRVMALLVAASRSPAGSEPGGSQAAERAAAELRDALARLRENLRAEQRLESEHHHAVFREVLTPLQGAHFIVKAYPAHCDTLAFMHGVAGLQK